MMQQAKAFYEKYKVIILIVLAAVLAVVCFLFGDMIAYFGFGVFTMGFQFFMLAFRMVLQSLIGTSMNALLSLMFRIGGVYLAYTTSRFV